jgi:hypothetical protein
MYILFLPRVGLCVSFLTLANARFHYTLLMYRKTNDNEIDDDMMK